jgi:hypothetical protein
LRHEPAILERCAEVDLDTADLAGRECEELGVAKAPAIPCQAVIGDESLMTGDKDALDLVTRDPAGVAPAAFEIVDLVDVVEDASASGRRLDRVSTPPHCRSSNPSSRAPKRSKRSACSSTPLF